MSSKDPAEAEDQAQSGMELASERDYLLGAAKKASSGTFGLIKNLERAVGYELLAILFVVEHVMRGFVAELGGSATTWIYKEYSFTASQITIYAGVTSLPWALKPLIGLASDMFPIGGYNKAPYMLIFSVSGALAYMAVGVSSASTLPATLLVLAIFSTQLQLSTCDVLCEAKYAEKIQEKPEIGPDMLSYVWGGMTVLSLFADIISGFVISWSPHAAFAICAVPASLVIAAVAMGYMSEPKANPIAVAEKRSKFFSQFEVCFLAALVTAGVVALMVCGLVSSSANLNAVAALLTFIIVAAGFGIMLSPQLAMFSVYSILQASLTLSTGGASYYFFTDTEKEYPEGPHFSAFFYNSVLGTSAGLMSLLGIATFHRYFAHYSYRNLLLATNLAFGVLSLLDVMVYSRLNVKLGIPDHVFVLGSTCMETMVSMWQWMPQVIIMSYFCPKGMEATMYALLAGCHNLGNTVASCWGAWLLEFLEVGANGSSDEGDAFKNLWVASLIASALPTVTVAALFKLVPDVKQGDAVVDPDASAVEGSLWRKWRG